MIELLTAALKSVKAITSKVWECMSVVQRLISIISSLLAIYAVFQFFTPTIDLKTSESRRVNDPLSKFFELTNPNQFPISKVFATCVVNKAENTLGGHISDLAFRVDVASKLGHGETKTFWSCQANVFGPSTIYKAFEVSIQIDYQYLFVERCERLKFSGTPLDEGPMKWSFDGKEACMHPAARTILVMTHGPNPVPAVLPRRNE